MNNLITIKDAFIVPFLLLVAYLISTKIRNNNLLENPYYKYFRIGLFVKIFAGLVFALIYLLYYGGGDTVYYFWGSGNIVKMFGKDIPTFLKLLGGNHSLEVFSMFDRTTGWPTYFRDPNSFAVCRFNVPFYVLGMGSFLGNTIVMNLLLYFSIWRFYKMLVELYPTKGKWLAYAVFFIPSVVFWSSGILKDSWTFISILTMYSTIYYIFIKREKVLINFLIFLVFAYVAFSIRPYIFYVTIASSLIWISFSIIQSIKNKFFKLISMPFIIILIWTGGILILVKAGSAASDKYSSIDAMLKTAWVIQDDLRRDYYGGNSFDIGGFEQSIPGILKKAPIAILSGTLRPFIWEGSGMLLLLSGLENAFMMLLIIYTIFKVGILRLIKFINKQPFLLSIFVFAITYSFFVGLTTANFGALVRYRIPALPFLLIIFLLSIDYSNGKALLDKKKN